MIRYTLGFLFNKDLSKVLLIRKLSPDWQKGKVNGLGGKFEEGEVNTECISREVREESGLITNPSDWRKIGELHSSQFDVDVMTAMHDGSEGDARSMEDEKVEWFSVGALPKNCMSNLFWLVPLCIDAVVNKKINVFVVRHTL